MNPGPKIHAPWWATYLENAMKSWGIAVVIILGIGGLLGAFSWKWGGLYVAAKISVEESNARTFSSVAKAVDRLTQLADEQRQFQKTVNEVHTNQLKMMGQHEDQTKAVAAALQQEITFRQEQLQILKEIRDGKNPDHPSPNGP